MKFLPEDDRLFLEEKKWEHDERSETVPGGGTRNALVLPTFAFEGDLHERIGEQLIRRTSCELLILIPDGYSTTKLDSWYTRPRLYRSNGTTPINTEGTQAMFGVDWQFWSRHLGENEWRAGIDGLETYLQYVRQGLRSA
jgi:hypothetical protein